MYLNVIDFLKGLRQRKKSGALEETMFEESHILWETYCYFVSFPLAGITRVVAKYLKDNSPLTNPLP